MLSNQVLYCPGCRKALALKDGRFFCSNCSQSYPVIDGIPSFVVQDLVVDSFDASAFESLFEKEQKHFWHIGRKEMILSILKKDILNLTESRMLEIGCGNGSVLAYLKQSGVNIEGGDIFLEGLAFCRKRVGTAVLYHLDISALPFRDDFDIIGIFDVLEHIEDDDKALMEINQTLKPGGNLILTVPANKFLWSRFDVHSHHQRRYSKKELVKKLERNGFAVRRISFYMFFLFPLLAAVRMVGGILNKAGAGHERKAHFEEKTVPVVNDVFLVLLRLENRLLKYFALPFGSSLIAVAEKKRGLS